MNCLSQLSLQRWFSDILSLLFALRQERTSYVLKSIFFTFQGNKSRKEENQNIEKNDDLTMKLNAAESCRDLKPKRPLNYITYTRDSVKLWKTMKKR